MKNNMKLKVIIAIIIILIIIIGVIIGIVSNNSSCYIENSNYKIAKISKRNDLYEYTNNWELETFELGGSLTIKYNAEKHTIDRENQINTKLYDDFAKSNMQINGDLILNENKDGILIYCNGSIPYINSQNNTFGIIDSRVGYNMELEKGKKALDIIPTSLQPEVQIFLNIYTTEKEKQQLEEQIKQLSGVKKITFKSKEDALKIMKEKFKDKADFLKGYEGENNIFSESYVITLNDNSDEKNIEKEIKNMDLECVKKITTNSLNQESMMYQELLRFDLVIKDNNNKYSFATIDMFQIFSSKKINYFEDTYLDIYIVRDNMKELQGYIVENENNKKVFLNKYREALTKEYNFMNFVEVNSEKYIVCSNSNIKTEEDIKNADFEVFDVDGNSKAIDKNDFVELLKLKQKNYSDKNSLEYVLFK